MASKQQKDLNLPDSVRQLYHRRYSDSDHQRMKAQGLLPPGQSRRFSFSTSEEIRDITPASLRGHINQELKNSGFTAYKQAETQQYRRYSTHIDPNVVNLLRFSTRRGSFKESVGQLDTTTSQCVERKESVFNKSTESKYSVSNKDYKLKKTPTTINDDVKELWGDKCRDSLKAFRSRVQKSINPDTSTCVSYKRHSNDTDSESERLPKCKYKLRENGLITAQLASFGRHISVEEEVQEMSGRDLVTDAYQRSPSVETFHKFTNSTNTTPDTAGDDKMQIMRPHSSPSFRKVSYEIKTKAPLLSSRTPPTIPEDNYQYSFYQPEAFKGDTTGNRFQSELLESWQNLSRAEKRRWSTSSDYRRWSSMPGNQRRDSKPDFNFEIIGSSSLHGAPEYKGRLMVLTSRTVHFGDA